ncbi:MAG: TonB-dependent receptor [Bacteroidales bacterium]
MKLQVIKRFINILAYLAVIFLSRDCFSQPLRQTIRGEIRDVDSQTPLPGATVVIDGTDPVIGAVADADGKFRIEGIQVGRYNLRVTYIGYEPAVVSEVLVLSGKEVMLHIGLKESATTLQQVTVKAYSNKEQAINPMAMISARQLTMEEASRYAGGIDDPAHLATAFAGVAGSLSSNAIVIRGNAPKGLLWRMEGVEIPNPSHFANVSTFGGGGITALSSQMLSNSDFFTGAFPAEYGNALSGVFDMRIRTGNNEKREHTIKAGIIGVDFATEGPFIRGKKSSYLVNYRYSTLALISPLLPENARGIRYQDLSYKLNFPVGKSGNVSTWGLFSTDRTGSEVERDSTDWEYYDDREEDENKNRMGAAGLNYKTIVSDKTYMNAAVAATGNYISWHRNRLDGALELYPTDRIEQNDRKYTMSFLVNHKFSPKHTNRTGLSFNRLTYRINLKQFSDETNSLVTYADENGGSEILQFYSQSRLDVLPNLSLNAGIHAQRFSLTKELTVEPRASLKWKVVPKHTVSVAYGMHSRLEPIGFYFAGREYGSEKVRPNLNLKLAKAQHLVFSYELATGEYSRLRIEPFYQRLSDVPVIPGSSFSMMNLEIDWFFNDSLVNEGSGHNVGIDITLERFLHSGYYYLVTGSFFDSRYTGGDHIERSTRFNKNYVVNFLFGKEWTTGHQKNNILGINWKFSLLGGDRISPVDQASSALARDVIYNENKAFSERKPAVYYLDFSASWQRNKPRYSATWSFQFVNLLFQKEFYGHRYNYVTHTVEELKEIAVIPNISYRIDF